MKKTIFLVLASFLSLVVYAESADNNANLSLVKDKGTGLFILNMKDAQGIKSFSLVFPTDKLPYGGDLSGCSASKKIDNITISDPSDFRPLMNAVILDCQGNETEFEISAPVDGVAQVKKVGIEPIPVAPSPPVNSENGSGAPTGGINISSAGTDTLADIQYPIKDLGGCGSREACKAYCEKSENIERCVAFAEKNGLLSAKEIQKGKKFSELLKAGATPGECKTEKECHSYCNDTDKIEECVEFAEKNGFMEEKELGEAKKIRGLIKSGKNLPGNCKNRTACEAFCKNLEHLDECIAFAKEAGFMTEKEIAEAEKILPLMKSGQTPGGCKSREECEAFCEDENNFQKCFEFADKAGLITAEEREMMKKTGGKGPGGCKGRACQTFCENPENQKICFEFGKEHGLISEQDIKRMEEGKHLIKEQLESGPPEVQECLRSVVDINALETEGFAGGPALGEKMKECFKKMVPEGMRGQFEFRENGEFRGPGGCASQEECKAYCTANPDACGIKLPDIGAETRGMPPLEGNTPPAGEGGFSGRCSFMNFNPVCAVYGEDQSHTFNNECMARQHGATNIKQGACPEDVPCERTPSPVCGIKNGIIQDYFNKCVALGDNAEIKYESACRSDTAPTPGIYPTATKICPAMPTVNECPQGTTKTKVYSSPECGDYYACKPADTTNIYPTGDYKQQYEEQYKMQYEGQIQLQQTDTQPTTNFIGPGGCTTAEQCREYCTKNYTDPACKEFMPSSSVPIQSPLALLLWPFLELFK